MGEAFRGPGGGRHIVQIKGYPNVSDLPGKGRLGDFAVITDTKIAGCTVSLTEPTAAPGTVWIVTGDLADIAIAVGTKPALEIRPWLVRQYVNDEWAIMPAYAWAEGWQSLNGVQFYQGTLKKPWTLSASSNASAALNGATIRMTANSTGTTYYRAYLTASNLPLQSVQTLHVLYDKSGAGGQMRIYVAGKNVYNNAATVSNYHATVSVANYSAGTVQLQLETGWNINDGGSATVTIYKIWFT